MFRDHLLTTNSHRTLMVVGWLSVLGLGFALYLGWYEYFQERARRELLIKMAENSTQRASLMAAQRAADSEPLAGSSAAANAVTLNEVGKDEARVESTPLVRLPDAVTPEQLTATTTVLQKFWQATTWQDKLAYVHDAARVRLLLEAYYGAQRNKDPVSGKLLHSDRYKHGNQELIVHSYAGLQPGTEVAAILLLEADGSHKLDWESYVGWGDLPVQEFKKLRPTAAKTFRLNAKLDDSYKGEFSDPASYLVVELQSPDGLDSVHGYCDKGSPIATALLQATAGGGFTKLTVSLQYSAEGKTSESAQVVRVVADHWLVLK